MQEALFYIGIWTQMERDKTQNCEGLVHNVKVV